MKLEYENDSRLLCVIGDPIGHSLSPLLHNTMLEALGEKAVYLAIPVKDGSLCDFVNGAKSLNFLGFNLTMPHKESIIPLLSAMTPEALACGSVNSVRIREGRLEGHSTDGMGFRRALGDFGRDYPGKTVTILGAGGAAKSVAVNARDSGARQVHVVNRTRSRAEALCQGHVGMEGHGLEALPALLPKTDILINCTPAGMAGVSGGGVPDLSGLQEGALCMDCIYAPANTPFMEAAKALGHEAGNGIGMLIYQAIYAMSFFLDRPFDEDTVTALGKKLLAVSGIEPRGGGESSEIRPADQ